MATDTWVGWGQHLLLSSDFVGPLPVGALWTVRVERPEESTPVIFSHQFVSQSNPTTLALGAKSSLVIPIGAATQQVGSNVHITAILQDHAGGTQIDVGTTTVTWQKTVSDEPITAAMVTSATSGFTETDRQTIQQTQTNTEGITDALKVDLTAVGTAIETTVGAFLSPIRLEFSPQVSLSGGVTCEPIDIDIGLSAFYGLVVHVTQFPDDWRFGTPDGDWGFHDLAVLSCWIGDNQLIRCGIHTPSFVLSPMPGSTLPFVAPQVAQIQPPGYRVHLNWAPGVCGELLGVNLPG